MALANMARVATATTGAGTITLGAAVAGFLTFANAGITNGQTVSYAIEDGNNREVGRGVYSSTGPTLTRTVLRSTNANAAISLSGTAEVFITAVAEDFFDKATVAETRAATAGNKALTAEVIETAAAIVTLTDATSVAIDWDAFLVAQVTFAGNRTLANPTNVQPGTTRYIVVKGSDATARTISFGTNFKGDLPTDTVTSTSWRLIGLTALTTTHIVVSSCKAL